MLLPAHTCVCCWACKCWNRGLLRCIALDLCSASPPGASRVTTAAGRSKPLQLGQPHCMNSCSQPSRSPTCLLEREFSMQNACRAPLAGVVGRGVGRAASRGAGTGLARVLAPLLAGVQDYCIRPEPAACSPGGVGRVLKHCQERLLEGNAQCQRSRAGWHSQAQLQLRWRVAVIPRHNPATCNCRLQSHRLQIHSILYEPRGPTQSRRLGEALHISTAYSRSRRSVHLAIVVEPQRVQPQLGPPGDDLEYAQLRAAAAGHVLLYCATSFLLDCCGLLLAGACIVPQCRAQADL